MADSWSRITGKLGVAIYTTPGFVPVNGAERGGYDRPIKDVTFVGNHNKKIIFTLNFDTSNTLYFVHRRLLRLLSGCIQSSKMKASKQDRKTERAKE